MLNLLNIMCDAAKTKSPTWNSSKRDTKLVLYNSSIWSLDNHDEKTDVCKLSRTTFKNRRGKSYLVFNEKSVHYDELVLIQNSTHEGERIMKSVIEAINYCQVGLTTIQNELKEAGELNINEVNSKIGQLVNELSDYKNDIADSKSKNEHLQPRGNTKENLADVEAYCRELKLMNAKLKSKDMNNEAAKLIGTIWTYHISDELTQTMMVTGAKSSSVIMADGKTIHINTLRNNWKKVG